MRAVLWSAIVAQFALIVASLILTGLSHALGTTVAADLVVPVAFGVVTLTFPAVGALVLIRRPAQRVGWLLSVVALGWALANAASAHAEYAFVARRGGLPGGDWALWLSGNSWNIVLSQGLLLLLLFLLPTGSLASPSWRPAVVLSVAWSAATAATLAFAGGALQHQSGLEVANPAAAPEPLGSALRALAEPLQLGFLALFALATTSLVRRLRRSRGVERQQLKWIAAAAIAAVIIVGSVILALVLGSEEAAPDEPILGGWLLAFVTVGTLSPGLLPLAIGVAVLRHGLYEIDVLINRALVYGVLSALLVGTYVLSVLAFSALLRPLTGSGELAVAVSTLAVVALFQPLRRRIQGAVDRRFYRSRYDAARTLDRFGTRLREQVDLDDVRADLLGAVHETVRPAHASVWLREAGR
ncbi:MAG: hypothetical protein ACRDGE_11995 [Candidatus Limnocylindria bacterium]